MTRHLLFLTLAAVLIARDVLAQGPAPEPQSPVVADDKHSDDAGVGVEFAGLKLKGLDFAALGGLQQPADAAQTQVVEGRPCDGCPPRRLGTAFLQATYINVFYELANLIRGQDTAHITPKTWWTNMKRGWEWDLDEFAVNQIGHPYQGNNYFTAGRANGLDFWESAALTAFGSGTWEYFGETNQASLNDFINTTLGGIALGEMFHRTAWLVRNTQLSGKPRLMKEIAATAIDPITGVNRFISGDSSRISEKPADMVPSTLGAMAAAGVIWRGSNTDEVDSVTGAFIEMDALYGDVEAVARSRTPYDAFAVRLTFGGGSALSEARVRGRLIGQPYRHGTLQLTVAQGYQYNANPAYRFGAESVDARLGGTKNLTDRTSVWANAWGGVTILGAVDSIPLEGKVEEVPDPEAGQGVSTGPRYYDYGPGTNFGGYLNFKRGPRTFLTFGYEAHHLHVLDGVRANHLLQRARADLLLPLRGQFGIGVTGEYFDRRTYYQQPGVDRSLFQFPQFRLALTWSPS
jgi:Domain of unknown function (DUF3943)